MLYEIVPLLMFLYKYRVISISKNVKIFDYRRRFVSFRFNHEPRSNNREGVPKSALLARVSWINARSHRGANKANHAAWTTRNWFLKCVPKRVPCAKPYSRRQRQRWKGGRLSPPSDSIPRDWVTVACLRCSRSFHG